MDFTNVLVAARDSAQGSLQVPENWGQGRAAIQSSADGYSHVDATLWGKHGRACVLSRQTVSVFA
jgi:hypothetical protein